MSGYQVAGMTKNVSGLGTAEETWYPLLVAVQCRGSCHGSGLLCV